MLTRKTASWLLKAPASDEYPLSLDSFFKKNFFSNLFSFRLSFFSSASSALTIKFKNNDKSFTYYEENLELHTISLRYRFFESMKVIGALTCIWISITHRVRDSFNSKFYLNYKKFNFFFHS